MSDLKGVEIHDLFGISEPLKKLIETVSNAIGKVYEPFHIRRMMKAKSEEISIISTTINENLQLPMKYDDGTVSIDATNVNELVQRTQNRLLYQEVKKQQNIESVVLNAYKELETVDLVSSAPVDNDWISVFFDSVANISTEQMQTLWGKLLAGEITEPGSFSLRTLATLKNLTVKEAALFQKIIPYLLTCPGNKTKSIEDHFLLCRGRMLAKYEITFPDIMLLDEVGLISLSDQAYAGFTLEPNQSEMIVCRSTNKAIKVNNLIESEVSIFHPSYLLTESGKALVPIAEGHGFQVPLDSYLIDCLNAIKKHEYNQDVFESGNNKASIEIVDL